MLHPRSDDNVDYCAIGEDGELEHWKITCMDMISIARQVTLAMVRIELCLINMISIINIIVQFHIVI